MRTDVKAILRVVVVSLLYMLASLAEAADLGHRSGMTSDYVAIRPVVNMYRAPSQDSDVISQAIYGTKVTLVESDGDWGEIRTADQYTGWAQMQFLKAVDGQGYAEKAVVIRVAQMSANIYRDQDVTKHEPLITVPWETRLEVVGEDAGSGRWIEVRLADGRLGFIQRGDVTRNFDPVDIGASIAIAKRFVGVTYTWGGTSSFGFDCSGFVQMILRQRGVITPRDASQQVGWPGFMAVKRDELQPGDVLYFGSSAENVTHTGMYIGNGQFIHDTTYEHPMVQISKLDDDPWTKLLVAARRVKK